MPNARELGAVHGALAALDDDQRIELAGMILEAVIARLRTERGRRGHREVLAWRSEPFTRFARALTRRESAPIQARSLPGITYLSCAEYAATHNLHPSTVRKYAQRGRLDGAVKVGAQWVIPSGSPTP